MNKSGTTNRKVTRREVIRKVLKDRKHVWHKLVGCVGPEMEETFGQEKSGKVVVKRNMTRTSITDLMVVAERRRKAEKYLFVSKLRSPTQL